MESNSANTDEPRPPPTSPYRKVFDARKRRIRGLWRRNDRFYAQLTIADPQTGKKQVRRIPLKDAETVPQAVEKYQDLLKERRDDALPSCRQAPKFAEYAAEYFKFYESVKDAKRASTLKTEKGAVRHWNTHLGHFRLDQINRPLINAYIAKRQAAGVSGRTVNLEVIILRNVLKRAIDDGLLKSLPTENLRPLKWTPKKRELLPSTTIEQLCNGAVSVSKNGQEFADYIRLMAYCGSRKTETLGIRWADVDWERKQLTIGWDGQTKNHESRVVDFNPKLEAHLKSMATRRQPDSIWLFPSPQRGKRDVAAKSLVETMRLAKKAAGIASFGFHDCRHHFISYCVMSGIDFMTIARWVGHKDGGVLIGKVYGHLSNEHLRRQAQRIKFGDDSLDGADKLDTISAPPDSSAHGAVAAAEPTGS